MKKTLWFAICVLLVIPSAAGAAAIEVQSINFPEGSAVDVSFTAQAGAPAATVNAKITHKDGQSRINLSYSAMKPAILFGGDVTSYVLWALNRDGKAQNLGEVMAAKPKGQGTFATGKKSFALIITAEPFYLVNQPSSLVVFVGDGPKQKQVAATPFSFTKLGERPPTDMDSIQDIAWASKEPLELLQARKAYEIAGRHESAKYARSIYLEAGEELDEANALYEAKPKASKGLQDQARQSVELSNEAMNIARQRMATLEFMALLDARRAEMIALEEQAVVAKAEVAALMQQKQQLEATMIRLNREKAAAKAQSARLSELLGTALGKVANAQNTAEGYVVSLPDILFDVSKATLKTGAKPPLAKLAGILLILESYNLAIEGFTDASGSEDFNRKLSQDRAEAVMSFLAEEGIAPERMIAMGLGPDNPIADNSTTEGRSKNRRVEILLGERATAAELLRN
jgi:outer membrane protein OmpA-like peptidoglycan-associated protein